MGKRRQLENTVVLGLPPDAGTSQTDLVTAALELMQAAVLLGLYHALLRGNDREGQFVEHVLSLDALGVIITFMFI